jgi:hypothetical protein
MSDEPEAGTGSNEAEKVLREEIELRAYFKYRERGCADGCATDDWLAAEQEILADRAALSPSVATGTSQETAADAAGSKGAHTDAPAGRGRERAPNRSAKR